MTQQDPPPDDNAGSRDSGRGGDATPDGGGTPEGGGAERPPRGASPGGRMRGRWGPTLLVVAVLIGVLVWLAQVWTDFLWFDSVGYRNVLTTRLGTQVLLFVLTGLLAALLLWVSLTLAYRHRPIYAPVSPEQESLDRYRAALEPVRKLVFIAVPVVLGLFVGTAGSSQWKTVLLWWNRQPFDQVDPEFGMDIGFFVFTLPFLEALVSFATLVLGLAVIVTLLTHYVYGGIQLQGQGPRTTGTARVQIALVVGAVVAVRAVAYWLERYSLTTTSHARITGMTYTDVNAVLPTRGILAIAALLCAIFFFSTIWTRSWRLPLVGLVGLVVVALLVGGAYPALVQSLKVRPSEAQLEEPYIERGIEATIDAYGLDNLETNDYQADVEAGEGQLREDAATVPGIRIVDPSVVSPTFRQLQGVRNYYQFPEVLDVDRYQVDGELTDTVIAVRELRLEGVADAQRNWVNDHTVYTHGFGVVAAYGNRRSSEGQPVFYERNIPPVGELGDYEPRIYFGEYSPEYSIVGGPDGATPRELDFPTSEGETGEQRNTYQAAGGVAIGSLPRQVAYALKYRELEILLSDSVNDQSRILDHREPRERVERVAPWLRLDGNAYPAVVDGRVQWIIDGYTTSNRYPYSQLNDLGQATTDSLQGASNVRSIGEGQVNYIRNSVKATVDAYDGTIKLYAWEDEDPLLQAWSAAFDQTLLPMSEIDGELMTHLRYPEDLFKVQRETLSRYHVDSAGAFFGGGDFWQVSEDPSVSGDVEVDQPPYYLSIAMPGQDRPRFSLTSNYIPQGDRQNLTGYLAVDAEAGSEDGTRREGYGQLRLLDLPRDSTVQGPGQFQNEIESSNATSEAFNQTLSQYLTLNRQQGSEVQIGNLLTLPVGGGLLYVEPVYVQASGGSSYPLQRLVVVAFGNDLAWSDTLDAALDELFGGDSGATTPDQGTGAENPGENAPPAEGEQPPADGEQPPADGESPDQPADQDALDQALADIEQAYQDGQEALAENDFAAYGEAQDRLEEAIARAVAASPSGGSTSVDPGDGASSTESP